MATQQIKFSSLDPVYIMDSSYFLHVFTPNGDNYKINYSDALPKFSARGEFEVSPSSPYLFLDLVSFNGSSYFATKDNPTSGNPDVTGDWQLLSEGANAPTIQGGTWWINGVDTGVSAKGSVITIGVTGNWEIDGVDTGVKAEGEKGDKGDTGTFVATLSVGDATPTLPGIYIPQGDGNYPGGLTYTKATDGLTLITFDGTNWVKTPNLVTIPAGTPLDNFFISTPTSLPTITEAATCVITYGATAPTFVLSTKDDSTLTVITQTDAAGKTFNLTNGKALVYDTADGKTKVVTLNSTTITLKTNIVLAYNIASTLYGFLKDEIVKRYDDSLDHFIASGFANNPVIVDGATSTITYTSSQPSFYLSTKNNSSFTKKTQNDAISQTYSLTTGKALVYDLIDGQTKVVTLNSTTTTLKTNIVLAYNLLGTVYGALKDEFVKTDVIRTWLDNYDAIPYNETFPTITTVGTTTTVVFPVGSTAILLSNRNDSKYTVTNFTAINATGATFSLVPGEAVSFNVRTKVVSKITMNSTNKREEHVLLVANVAMSGTTAELRGVYPDYIRIYQSQRFCYAANMQNNKLDVTVSGTTITLNEMVSTDRYLVVNLTTGVQKVFSILAKTIPHNHFLVFRPYDAIGKLISSPTNAQVIVVEHIQINDFILLYNLDGEVRSGSLKYIFDNAKNFPVIGTKQLAYERMTISGVRAGHDCTFVGTEFWSFNHYISSKSYVLDSTTNFSALNQFDVDFVDAMSQVVQMKSVDYSLANDAILVGNGRSGSTIDNSHLYLFYDYASWKTAPGVINFGNCGDYVDIDITSLNLTKTYGYWGSDHDLIYVTSDWFGKITLIQVGKGTNNLGGGTYSPASAGKLNGSWRVVRQWTQKAMTGISDHGGQWYNGSLYIANNDNTRCDIYKLNLRENGSIEFEKLALTRFTDTGLILDRYIDGLAIKDGYIFAQPLNTNGGGSVGGLILKTKIP